MPPIEFLADATTQVTISQGGQTVQQFVGPIKLALPEGSYQVTTKATVGAPTTRLLIRLGHDEEVTCATLRPAWKVST